VISLPVAGSREDPERLERKDENRFLSKLKEGVGGEREKASAESEKEENSGRRNKQKDVLIVGHAPLC